MSVDLSTISPTQNVAGPETVVQSGWIKRVRERIFHRRVLTVIGLAIMLGLFWAWLSPQARIAIAAAVFQSRALFILMALFSLITLSLLWSAGQEMDAWLFMLFNVRGIRSRWLDGAMWLLTQLGNMGLALAAAAVLYALAFERLAIEIVLGLLSLWLVVETVKAVTDRTRPFALLKDVRIIGWRALGRSFPSGHTAQAFFIASLFVNRFDLLLWGDTALFVTAGLVGVTRMYVGAHYPRDVIAGALIGLVWAFLISLSSAYLYPG
ncbi:MAG: phosphatase PAP2 family protein [Chloroflexi bacterium]|nr:phosphatase PAP2 family protein [Chloroflexota bacterium]